MTETENLFLRTLDDVEKRLQSEDPYEILGLSWLIRKLFLDDYPLVDQVNRNHRLKIRFLISDPNNPYAQMIKSEKPLFYSVQDGLDPETKLTKANILDVNRDQFFATEVLITSEKSYSVKDIIIFEANIMGGVHADTPKTEKEKALAEVNNLYIGGDTKAALRQLKSIGRVTFKALKALQVSIEKSA